MYLYLFLYWIIYLYLYLYLFVFDILFAPQPHLYWFLFLYLTNCLNLYFYLILHLHLCVCNFILFCILLFILICRSFPLFELPCLTINCAAIKTCKGFNLCSIWHSSSPSKYFTSKLNVFGQNFPESGTVSFHVQGSGKQMRIYGVYPFGTSLLSGLIVIREIDFGFLYFSGKIVCSFATCSTCSEKCEAQH